MDTKLTLRLDRAVIERMKIYASKQQKSLSALTEELYKSLLMKSGEVSDFEVHSPIVRKNKGIISSTEFDAAASKLSYLKDKHLS